MGEAHQEEVSRDNVNRWYGDDRSYLYFPVRLAPIFTLATAAH